MSEAAENSVIGLQLAHRSIRAFTDRPVDADTLELLIRAGQSAATSSFLQAYSVIRVRNPDVRKAIAELAGGQPWVVEAPELLVYCADLNRADMACRAAGLGPLEGQAEHGLTAIIDVALMAQNVLLAAESLGMGGVYIGGIRNDLDRITELLRIPPLAVPVFGMCLGWPADDPDTKPRIPPSLVLHEDAYQLPSSVDLDAYDAQLASYYAARSSNRKRTTWSRSAAAALQGKKRPGVLGFLQRQGFFLR